jgi:hypothetical protein
MTLEARLTGFSLMSRSARCKGFFPEVLASSVYSARRGADLVMTSTGRVDRTDCCSFRCHRVVSFSAIAPAL